jgi:hypothetical protein
MATGQSEPAFPNSIMSVLCQRLESSLLKALLQSATPETDVSNSFSQATEAISVAVTNTGIQWDSAFGSFILNFYTGLSQEEQTLPAVTIACVQAQADEAAPAVHSCEMQVALKFPADDSSAIPSVPEALHGLGVWLENEFAIPSRTRDNLEMAEHSVIVTGVTTATGTRGIDADNRSRWLLFTFTVTASLQHYQNE